MQFLLLLVPKECLVLFAFAFKGFFNKDFKKLNTKPNSLKLDSEQKEALKNSADEVAKYIFSKINPLTAFFIGATLFYGQNLFEQIELKKENLKQ